MTGLPPLPEHIRNAREILNIPTDPDHRVLLSVDGGGSFDMVAVELLKAIEQRIAPTGTRLCELFDLVGGVSGGAVMTSLLALGKSADEIGQLYSDLVRFAFVPRRFGGSVINAPLYTKKKVVDFFEERIGPNSLTMSDAVRKTGVDHVYTTKDIWSDELVAIGAYADGEDVCGPYRDSLLVAALTASIALPNLFSPLERFVDGGATLSQNPALPILYGAMQDGPDGKYQIDKMTLFSLGSPLVPVVVDEHDIQYTPAPRGLVWLSWTLAQGWGNDISSFHDDVLRSEKLFPGLDYRRFDLSYDCATLCLFDNAELPALKWPLNPHPVSFFVWLGELFDPPRTLHDLTDIQLLQWAVFNPDGIPLFEVIGRQMAAFILKHQPIPFGTDLLDYQGNPLLLSRRQGTRIGSRYLANQDWFDRQNLAT